MLELVSALGDTQAKPLTMFDEDDISVGSADNSIGTNAEAPVFANNVRIKSKRMLKDFDKVDPDGSFPGGSVEGANPSTDKDKGAALGLGNMVLQMLTTGGGSQLVVPSIEKSVLKYQQYINSIRIIYLNNFIIIPYLRMLTCRTKWTTMSF